MNPGQRIELLEKEIRQLAKEHTESQQRLVRLFEELKLLKTQVSVTNAGSPDHTSPGTGLPLSPAATGIPHQQPSGSYPGTVNPAGQLSVTQHGLEQFIGLRLIHLAGIIVLLTGISIGVKYAIDKDLVSPLARIMLAYAAGLVLFIISMRLRKKYNFFSAILFSGSMACCYFTTYGALAYYHFLTTATAFVIMVALTVFTVIRSIYYNRIEIALIGLVGAYGIPFLVSNNTGRMDLFFAYILLINTAVVFLGFRKNWQVVTRLSLVITWALYLGWLLIDYSPGKQQWLAIAAGSGFYLLFMCAALAGRLFYQRLPGKMDNVQVLVLNTLLYFASVLVFSPEHTEPLAETGLLFLFTGLQALVAGWKMKGEDRLFRLLTLQALCLLVLYIGLRWDGITVTLLWISVSVLLFIAGVYARAGWLRVCSVMLIGGTLLKLITLDAVRFSAGQRIISFVMIGILLLIGSFYYQRFNTPAAKAK